MKFQRTPLILLLIALGLGGVVYFTDRTQTPQPSESSQSAAQPIFSFKEEEVQSFTVKTRDRWLAFEKRSIGGAGLWRMNAPEQVPANDATVAFLLNLLATGRSERTFTVPANRKAEFGLDNPVATVEVKLQNQQRHQLVIGNANFNRSAVYALINPPATPAADISLAMVPIELQNAVDRPLTEWKPEVKKPDAKEKSKDKPASQASPTATPTPSPTTSPEAQATPSPSAIASPEAQTTPNSSPPPATATPQPTAPPPSPPAGQ